MGKLVRRAAGKLCSVCLSPDGVDRRPGTKVVAANLGSCTIVKTESSRTWTPALPHVRVEQADGRRSWVTLAQLSKPSCEDCQRKPASFGTPAGGWSRWCGGCARAADPGAEGDV
eukprot:SAG11_NODE_9597_length_897_cov_1.055138_2_plen_114_part_01